MPPPGTIDTIAASASTIATLRTFFKVVLTPEAYAAGHPGVDRSRRRRAPGDALLARGRCRQLRGEAVADPEVRVHVDPAGRDGLELVAQLAHEHVDGAIAARHREPPDPLVDLLALEHAPVGRREQPQELEFLA